MPVVAVGGREDRLTDVMINDWMRRAGHPDSCVKMVPGGHFFVSDKSVLPELVTIISETLKNR